MWDVEHNLNVYHNLCAIEEFEIIETRSQLQANFGI